MPSERVDRQLNQKDCKVAAERFRQSCRDLGLTTRDYPLKQSDKAVRSLARTLRGWITADADLAARVAGARLKPSSALRRLPERAALLAFDTVEFDAHKMDLRLKVLDVDPIGNEHVWEIERVWLLAIIDVATRCILGWHLSLARECNRTHVVDTIKHAVTPQSLPAVTLPGLRLLPTGGFVSHNIEATRYSCWRQMRLDNARAHLATTSLDVLCETLGCTADFGPAYQPDDRPFIERFFGTVTRALSRRLPGALPGPEGAQARTWDQSNNPLRPPTLVHWPARLGCLSCIARPSRQAGRMRRSVPKVVRLSHRATSATEVPTNSKNHRLHEATVAGICHAVYADVRSYPASGAATTCNERR